MLPVSVSTSRALFLVADLQISILSWSTPLIGSAPGKRKIAS
jgi:hypothetical protein